MNEPVLPEREGALAAAAEVVVEPGGWFRKPRHLGSRAPVDVQQLAAVWLQGRAVRRESWSRSEEMAETDLERLANVDTTPRLGAAQRSFQRVDTPQDAVRARCTNCSVRPGLGPCPRCVGTGKVLVNGARNDEQVWVSCNCDGGFVRCTLCNGSQRVARADVRFVTDHPVAIEQMLVPTVARELSSVLERLGSPIATPAFFCDLASAPIESAYRGAATMTTPSFHGFDLLDVAERARDQLAELRARYAAFEIRTFAVPFVLLRYGSDASARAVVVRREADGTYLASLA